MSFNPRGAIHTVRPQCLLNYSARSARRETSATTEVAPLDHQVKRDKDPNAVGEGLFSIDLDGAPVLNSLAYTPDFHSSSPGTSDATVTAMVPFLRKTARRSSRSCLHLSGDKKISRNVVTGSPKSLYSSAELP